MNVTHNEERRFLLQHPDTRLFYRESYKGKLIWTPLKTLASRYTGSYACSLDVMLQQLHGVHGLRIVEDRNKISATRVARSEFY